MKIAIVRLSALGDIVNAAVVVQFIKAAYSGCRVEWICEEHFAPLVKRIDGVDAVHSVGLRQLKKERKLSLLREQIAAIRSFGEYDIAIDMQGLLKSSIVAKLTCKRVHGYDKNSIRERIASLFYTSTTAIAYEENIILRNVALINDALNLSVDTAAIEQKRAVFLAARLQKKQDLLFVLGASWESKIYPAKKLAKVCRALQKETLLIWGDEEERKRAETIALTCKHAVVAPKLSLEALIDTITNTRLLIGNDTGPTHIAWAQNIASVTLFGPTNRRMIYTTERNIAVESDSHVDILKIDKEDFSIRDIDETRVIEAARRLL